MAKELRDIADDLLVALYHASKDTPEKYIDLSAIVNEVSTHLPEEALIQICGYWKGAGLVDTISLDGKQGRITEAGKKQAKQIFSASSALETSEGNKEVKEYLLKALLYWMNESNRDFYSFSRLIGGFAEFAESLHERDVEIIVGWLIELKYVEAFEDMFADTFYTVSEKGKNQVKEDSITSESVPYKWEVFGDDWMKTALMNISSQLEDGSVVKNSKLDENSILEGITSYEDNQNGWSPLPIERESPGYIEAVSKTEEALEVIEGDNGYADSELEERNHIVWAIGAGVNAVKEGLITKQQIDSLLLTPLRRVIERLKEGVTVEAARAAVQSIVEWLKGLF